MIARGASMHAEGARMRGRSAGVMRMRVREHAGDRARHACEVRMCGAMLGECEAACAGQRWACAGDEQASEGENFAFRRKAVGRRESGGTKPGPGNFQYPI